MPLAASITLMFRELPLLERFAAARAAGFLGVEIQRLHEGDPQEMARAARDAGVEVVLVNVGLGDFLDGGHGLSGVPGCEAQFRDAFDRAVTAADELRAHHLHLGPSRIPDGISVHNCLRVYEANVHDALHASERYGTSLLVEAMNDVEFPTALFAAVDSAARMVSQLDHPRIGLQFDTYHTAMNDEDIVAAYRRHRAAVRHVQFADAPGRHEPGTGRANVAVVLADIRASGYAGWFGAEYRPLATTNGGLSWMTDDRFRSLA